MVVIEELSGFNNDTIELLLRVVNEGAAADDVDNAASAAAS